jgi:hypothetical protein
MVVLKKQIDIVFDGVFYLFGFIENPAENKVKSIMDKSSSEKIKTDIKRINKDYRNKYAEMRKQVFSLEY